MTNPDAANAIYGIIQMMLSIGLPLCMVAGWHESPKDKTKNRQRGGQKRGRRPASVKASDLVKDRKRKAKTAVPRPLSDWEDRILADYFVKRNFVST